MFTASEYIDASARQTGNVLIISFKQPLDVSVDRMAEQAPDYIGAARRDPDGMAVRVALEQSVTVHAMAAGEKFFVDLLPASWSGVPPGLPQDVVDELARRAREAEKLLQRQHDATQDKKLAPIRVHVASQPTFTRYLFNVPNQTAVSADRTKDRLILNFDKPVSFDLADAEAALPSAIEEISSELDSNSSLVRFIFAAKVDVRTFRDEAGYIVDVAKPDADPNAGASDAAAMQQGTPPATVPATKPAQQGAAGAGAAPSFADAAAKISAADSAPAPIAAPAPQPTAAPVAPPVAPAAVPAAAIRAGISSCQGERRAQSRIRAGGTERRPAAGARGS